MLIEQSSLITFLSETASETEKVKDEKLNPEKIVSELYMKLRPALLLYVYNLVHSDSNAEDLIHLAFLQFYQTLNKGIIIEKPRPWLYRVVHNFAINDVLRVKKRESLLQEWFVGRETEIQESAEEDLIRRDQTDKLLRILNEKERNCLLLRSEGLSYKEIAEILEITPTDVGVCLTRGLKRFRSKND